MQVPQEIIDAASKILEENNVPKPYYLVVGASKIKKSKSSILEVLKLDSHITGLNNI